jgi:hypothetical protein
MNETEEVKRDYRVAIEVVTVHEYTIPEANSHEEAEAIAEDWFADGELGNVDEQEILSVDSYPVETEEDKFN